MAGRKLVMIYPAGTVVNTSKKQKLVKKFFDEEDSSFLEETPESSEELAGEESSDNEVVDNQRGLWQLFMVHGNMESYKPTKQRR